MVTRSQEMGFGILPKRNAKAQNNDCKRSCEVGNVIRKAYLPCMPNRDCRPDPRNQISSCTKPQHSHEVDSISCFVPERGCCMLRFDLSKGIENATRSREIRWPDEVDGVGHGALPVIGDSPMRYS